MSNTQDFYIINSKFNYSWELDLMNSLAIDKTLEIGLYDIIIFFNLIISS